MSASQATDARRIPADAAIDLQMHTIYSDGQWRPDELMDYVAAHGFRVVAVTDHDQLDHTEEIVALGAARGVRVLPAVEVTTGWRDLRADLLCFSADLPGEALYALVRRTERLQRENTRAVYDALRRRGYEFPRQGEVLKASGGTPRRPSDNARLLLRHGYTETFAQALDGIREAGYRSITAPLEETVAAAHASGAVALIAHPGRSGGEISRFDPPLLAEVMAAIPLDGVEVLYPKHTPEQVAAYAAFVAERGLLRSAGSDSHGPHGRLPIAYPASRCAALLTRCGIEVAAGGEG